MTTDRIADTSARWISGFFSPLWMPTYGLAILLTTSYLAIIPAPSRWVVVVTVALITGLTPLLAMVVMKRWGFIGDLDVKDHALRTPPLLTILICYVAAWLFLTKAGLPDVVTDMVAGAAIAVAVMIPVSRVWKISAHAAGNAALVAMVWVEMTKMLTVSDVFPIFVIVVAVAGLVGTSRLLLERHTLMQVLAGWALGFGCVALACM